jgi:mannobiose 2-epimerase
MMMNARRPLTRALLLAMPALAAPSCAAAPRAPSTTVATAGAGTVAAGAISNPAPLDPALIPRLDALRARLDRLGQETFEFWRVHGPDPRYGGFYGTLDRQGHPAAPTDKGLTQTARHLWAMSTWYERKQPTPEVKALADNLYHFLLAHFYDPASHEFYFTVSQAGALVEPRKILAAQALSIYALSQYARAFGSSEAGRYALATFQAVDARAHDTAAGGYKQINDAFWLPPGSEKETNTQVHLMEAFTALYAYGHDATVRARLEEQMAICTDKLLQPSGYLHRDFRLDWSLVGAPAVSYGHDMETGWLLLEAARVLGRLDDARLVGAAKTMILGPAAAGYDAEQGGYFEEGPPGAAPVKREKIWWTQAEALLGLWRMFELTRDPVLLDRFERTLGFIERHQRDAEYGEWFWGVLPDGSIGPSGDGKGNAWKASYHTVRALVFSAAWIEQATAAARARAAAPATATGSR